MPPPGLCSPAPPPPPSPPPLVQNGGLCSHGFSLFEKKRKATSFLRFRGKTTRFLRFRGTRAPNMQSGCKTDDPLPPKLRHGAHAPVPAPHHHHPLVQTDGLSSRVVRSAFRSNLFSVPRGENPGAATYAPPRRGGILFSMVAKLAA